MKIMITGIAGFAGSHLAEYLFSLGDIEVTGLDLSSPPARFREMLGGRMPPVHSCDLADTDSVNRALAEEQPDAVIHLAAMAQVAGAWERAADILCTNIVCTESLLEAVRDSVPKARTLIVSSSEVYGKVAPNELPLTEESPLRPNNPYSVSKVSKEFVGKSFAASFGTEVVIARPFNHIGPRQLGNFVVASFARQLAEIEAGRQEPVLRVGNLESKRDFTDVRDIVRAYYLLLKHGKAGEVYNIASGTSHSIKEILDTLIGLSTASPRIETIPELMRPSDLPDVRGDCRKLKSLGEWEATVPLEQSLKDTLNYWRGNVGD